MKLVYWMKSNAYEEEWDPVHHVTEQDGDYPDNTLCGLDLTAKPGLYTMDIVGGLEGIRVCQRCARIRDIRMKNTT